MIVVSVDVVVWLLCFLLIIDAIVGVLVVDDVFGVFIVFCCVFVVFVCLGFCDVMV